MYIQASMEMGHEDIYILCVYGTVPCYSQQPNRLRQDQCAPPIWTHQVLESEKNFQKYILILKISKSLPNVLFIVVS